jgi:TonB family protein
MSKSFRNVDDSFGAHLTAAAQRQKNDATSEVAALLSERFEILGAIAESETYLLYLARDLGRARPDAQDGSDVVALKVLSGPAAGDDRQVNLFHLEARAAARLAHRNIIRAAEAEEVNGIHFCVIEHRPDAESLRGLLRREGWFELGRALGIIKQVADALDYAHGQGVLHLTLQPEKILVEPDGNVIVTGFGIESQKDLLWAHQERSHACAPQYISPEQVQCKQIDQRSDLYSLGIVMFEMLTDRVPFDSQDSISIKLKHLNRLPEPPHMFRPELPRLLCWLVMDLLKKKPDERPASVEVFESVLQQCMASGLEAGEAAGEQAATFDDDGRPSDGEQARAEDTTAAGPLIYVEQETEPDSSDAPTMVEIADEDEPRNIVAPLIISEADEPADGAGAFTDFAGIEAQNYSGGIQPDPARPEIRAAELPPETVRYDEEPAAFAFKSQVSTEPAEATSRPRSYRMAIAAAVLLVAAACLIWAMRGPRARQIARAEKPAIGADTNGVGKSEQESKAEAPAAGPTKSEALKSEEAKAAAPAAPKVEEAKAEAAKPTAAPAESEAANSAGSNKLVVGDGRQRADKPADEIGPVARREPPQVNSPALVPPVAAPSPSAPGAESGMRNAEGREASSEARAAEPSPSAQPPRREEPPAPKIIRRSGDVLQNSAISRVRPVYPEAARSAHVSGPVTVEVTLDEEGNVIAARAISGPDQLKTAAVDAARGWKWMPTRVDRSRVKVVGTITLNFQR